MHRQDTLGMTLSLAYFLQSADDIFQPLAGLNNEGIAKSYHDGAQRVRLHIVSLIRAAQLGPHEDVCYHFQVGTSLLMSLFDGLAVFVEKKLAAPPIQGIVYWKGAITFIDPRFEKLRIIQQRTNDYIIKGGITTNALRNFVKHYGPWLPLTNNSTGSWDIAFYIDHDTKTGPIIKGLLRPLFNDFCEAYVELCALLSVQPMHIDSL
jgi:hypothetical protein